MPLTHNIISIQDNAQKSGRVTNCVKHGNPSFGLRSLRFARLARSGRYPRFQAYISIFPAGLPYSIPRSAPSRLMTSVTCVELMNYVYFLVCVPTPLCLWTLPPLNENIRDFPNICPPK